MIKVAMVISLEESRIRQQLLRRNVQRTSDTTLDFDHRCFEHQQLEAGGMPLRPMR